MEDPSLEIIKVIKQNLPNEMNLVDFFTEIIPMKKEAAYRRLRGEIPLTLVEVKQIASYLRLSLDKLLKIKEEGTYSSNIVRMNGNNLIDAYCKTMEQVIVATKYMGLDPRAKTYAAIDVMPTSYAFKYPAISKFRFFKWAYQCRNTLSPLRMSEIRIPSKVRHIETTYMEAVKKIDTNHVWIRELFGPYINDVHYFSEMGLILRDEVKILREESFQLLEELEKDITVARTEFGGSLLVYLANTYFDANYIYVEGNNFKASAINVFEINFLSSVEEEICNDTKDWIESLMRYSTLISRSGEIERVNFFNLQRRMMEKSNMNNMYDLRL